LAEHLAYISFVRGLVAEQSLRFIGREIAKEIKRLFEAKVNPETIKSRALSMAGSNEPPQATPQEETESGEIKRR
jgi:hypothetical protein